MRNTIFRRSRRRILCVTMILCILSVTAKWTGIVEASIGGTDGHVITGFPEFDIQENSIYLSCREKPQKQDLIQRMPEKLDVFLDGSHAATAVSVHWDCMDCDFEKSDYYYYQFSPVWDEGYVLSEGLKRDSDVPYIGVFLQDKGRMKLFSVTGMNEETAIFKYLTETMGLNTAAACGVLANMYMESSFVSNNLQNSYERSLGYSDSSYTSAVDSGAYPKASFVYDQAGYGLCQWTYWSRKEGLYEFAKQRGASIADLSMQLDYFNQELSPLAVYAVLKNVPDDENGAYTAAYRLCYDFEKPANTEAASETRGNLAKNTYWPAYKKETDDTIPSIEEIEIRDRSSSGYTVHCVVRDAGSNLSYVTFPTWTPYNNDQDDITWHKVDVSGGSWEINYQVKVSDHNNEVNCDYVTDIYVYDTAGNTSNTRTGAYVDAEGPRISNVRISNLTKSGFDLTATVRDDQKVTKVMFPAWTFADGQDDLFENWETNEKCRGTLSGTTASYHVDTSMHNNETGLYIVHIYAYDDSGNSTVYHGQVLIGQKEEDYGIAPVSMKVYGGHTYMLFDKTRPDGQKQTWDRCASFCQSIGGHLVTISSKEENNAVAEMVSAYGDRCWIGLNDLEKEGTFVWEGGEPFSYSNWSDGEPNNDGGKENAGEIMTDGRWNDVGVDYTKAFICEWDSEINTNPETSVILGDVNGDEAVNNKDVAYLARSLVGKETLSVEQKEAADVNGDGTVNNKDVAKLARYLVGKEAQLGD